MSDSPYSRRRILQLGGQAAAIAGAVSVTGASAEPATAAAAAGGSVTLNEGTNVAAAASPDGRWVALDLLTMVWVLPASGGVARRLTDELLDATLPHWSPDSASVVVQAYTDGNYHLWLINLDGSRRQLTSGRFDHREPRFAPDGRSIAFASDRGGSGYGIYAYDLATGAISTISDTAAEQAAPTWSPDGRRVAYTVDGGAIDVVDVPTGAVTRAIGAAAGVGVFAPAFTPDGRSLAYVRLAGAACDLMVGQTRVSTGEDVFVLPLTWLGGDRLVYTADGRVWQRPLDGPRTPIPFAATVALPARTRPARFVRDLTGTRPQPVRGIAGPVASPDGTRVAFRALNALWLLSVGSPRPERLVADGYFASDPDFSPDGRYLVYSSDRAGSADLWRRDLTTGAEEQLTRLPGGQVAPRWSPVGDRIAFADDDGATWILDLATGQARQVVPGMFQPGRVSWSPDGRTLALAAVKPYSKRFREGTSQILTVDVATGALTYAEPMPGASLSTRGDDGPTWSPDGRWLAFVVDSVAWVAPVDGAGRITGPPRQVTHEYADSLSWRGERLMYLHAGRLREVSVSGGGPRTIPLELSWRRARATGHVVIQAGALWDGVAPGLRRDVDVVLDGDRIVAVEPTRPRSGAKVIDARSSTVMPGLIDAHVHWHLRGRQWGDRQGRLWLSYGVTTTRSPGDPVYQMLETREALESGARIGPRYFATGEAIDGPRVYYNFMRPTRDVAQADRELGRAEDLGYDLIKTYVRLPLAAQRRVAERAHRGGRKVSSHYLYPAAFLGMDAMEHTGATNRLGYSHTASRLERSYADVIELFAASGMSLTPTLFHSTVLYADDRSLVDDRRTRTLYPSWEYARLLQRVADAGSPAGEVARELLRTNVGTVLRVHRAGGLVITGTDAPLDHLAIALHMNLRAMVRFGFTPYEALTTATANPARSLGLAGRLGVVAPGAFADLAIVDGDPLSDITAAAAVRGVLVGGVPHRVDELLAAFPEPVAPATRAAHPVGAMAGRHWWHEPEWAVRACCGA
ncbi:amidohydrolase family protein [Krasilnikovia cinnamomea]|uniref:amidohydrolase family protein n=1 Tax=Krasilnikovia cinnamomea TaxID=349313 RepID=UPI001A934963|nr:amidohydrolase family protein [Krasilnikovia cinnamomea]